MKKQFFIPLMLATTPAILASCSTNVQEPTKPQMNQETPDTLSTSSKETEMPVQDEVSISATASVLPSGSGEVSNGQTSYTKTETVSYQTPGGVDDVEFTVKVENGIVTAASSKTLAINEASVYNQNNFASHIGAEVVGKSIKGLKLDTVGGASLTTAAFNKFIESL